MHDKLKNYLSDVGLPSINLTIEEKFIDDLNIILQTTKPSTKDEVEKLLTYKVPKLGPDGNYSILDQLDETPYRLKEILLYNNFSNEDIYILIYKLNKVIELLHDEIGANWTGIYKKLKTKTGPALVKLAYQGIASRVEFPLTDKFAEYSNNSTVGLSGKAVLIDNVRKHIQQGKVYYKIDDKMQSELCVPILLENRELVGTIVFESFQENFFDNKKIIKAAIACVLLSGEL